MIITEDYREQNRKLHESQPTYGTSGAKWREFVRHLADWGRLPILDYGCGKATLSACLGPGYKVTNYDPCIPGLDAEPSPHPVVICGDVMEHIEPEFIDSTLQTIRRLTEKKAFFVISLRPAQKHLEDGRNAHLSIHPQDWWAERLEANGFKIEQQANPNELGNGAWFICN